MTEPPISQPVLAPLTSSAIFLVLGIEPGGETAVRDLLSDLGGLQRSVGFRAPGDGLTCVAGIGSAAWDRLFGGPRPAALHPFVELTGAKHHAVATPGDVLLHIRAERYDLCFELAGLITTRVGAAVRVLDEVHGFRYFDQRDLLGFVDGTENPVALEAAEAALIGDQDPGFTGGSYVIVQKYLHDVTGWNRESTEEQERVVGRTKLADIELPDDVKPSNSHVALNTIVDADGTERQILRHNMAFGSVGDAEYGTYFIGYAADPDVTETMLRHMFLGDPPGNYDRILDFSTAVTGSLFFVPTVDFLEDPPVPAGPRTADSSLGIGSLRRSQQ
jgi:porphyrinogen peroxidase